MLQEGIFFESVKPKPPGFFTLVLLSPTPEATAGDVGNLLARLWNCYQGLKKGKVPDLGDESVPAGDLNVLLGLGSPAFDLPDRPAGAAGLPKAMARKFEQPDPDGGGPVAEGAGIYYEGDVTENPAHAAIAFRFTANTPLAVERAVVETWKLLRDAAPAALGIQAVYVGTQRDDGRSWIDFQDGLSNLPSADRPGVVTIPPPNTPTTPEPLPWAPPAEDGWTSGGTYLAFMRLYIDLRAWRALPTPRQEELVGREKISGLPLSAPGRTFPARPGDPVPPREADPSRLDEDIRLDSAIRNSHIQRSNHHEQIQPGGSANPRSHRIYRQGFPFLEPHEAPPGFRVGLNFVSFQSMPGTMLGMLETVGWLNNTNFGGDDVDPVVLLSARATGVFLVPPCEDAPPNGVKERFPGDRALTGRQPEVS